MQLTEANAPGQLDHQILDRRDLTVRQIRNKMHEGLTSRGKYRTLGQGGAFGRAYRLEDHAASTKNPDSIIKVSESHHPNPNVDPYIRYAKIASAHTHENVHLPRIHAITSILAKNGAVHVTKMERLHEHEDMYENEILQSHHHAFGGEEPTRRHEFWDAIFSAGFTAKEKTGPGLNKPYRHNRPIHQAFRIAIRARDEARRASGDQDDVGFDLHSGNVMFRKTPHGTHAVLTDPLVNRSDMFRMDDSQRVEREERMKRAARGSFSGAGIGV